MRCWIDIRAFPPGRTTVRFLYPDVDEKRGSYWLVIDDGEGDLCLVDPGHEVDLHLRSPLRTMTAIWMGTMALRAGMAAGVVEVDGPPPYGGSCRPGWGCRPLPRRLAPPRRSETHAPLRPLVPHGLIGRCAEPCLLFSS